MKNLIKKVDDRIIKIVFYSLWLIYWIFITWNIPYLADDWNWGTRDGVNQLVKGSLNHRYFGNFLVVILTRNVYVKSLFMAIVICLLVYVMTRYIVMISDNKAIECFIYCFIMFFILFMDKRIWAETFGWVSGFCNYVVSALFLMIYICIYHYIRVSKVFVKNSIIRVILLVFAIISMLCLENIAMVIAVCSAFIGFRFFSKKERNNELNIDVIILLVGNTIGFIIMFFNKFFLDLFTLGYQSAFDGEEGHLGREIIYSLDLSVKENIHLFMDRLLFILKIIGYTEYSMLFLLLCSAVIFICVHKKLENNKSSYKIIIGVMLICSLSLLPFLVVLITGFRVVLHQYLLFVLVLSFMVAKLLKVFTRYYTPIKLTVFSVSLFFVLLVGLDYYHIGITNKKQMDAIEECDGKELYLPLYSENVSSNLWRVYDIEDEYLKKYFRQFYNISDDTVVYFYKE